MDITTSKLIKEAVQNYPNECCGVLLGNRTNCEVLDIKSFNNAAGENRTMTHFKISPLDIYQVEQEIEDSNLEIIGFYHSHPDCEAIPSGEDTEHMIPGLAYIILSVTSTGVVDIRTYKKEL